ncbi:Lactonase, 7-bladed beta-propeller-domain-containing protein [Lasiosphaeria hispida]|uniref:Lactonase, 7-bladed beta-propeller-domain-containing protein n=1 Tax=Lasiosphaeria hispida TaxID=260671 RepID=A0AAJ0MF63_9PEZI|nr:Lactonase, 7-bladed beta-propeller-domain-containing protein [Lasiosphaeria hispida]
MTTSAFIDAMSSEPFYAFSASWPGPNSCGMSFSVDGNGSLVQVVDSWKYAKTSGVHGLALNQKNGQQLIYSADLDADLVWTHAVNKTSGKVKEVSRLAMRSSNMHPRHLAAHPNGKYLYVLMEKDNSLAQFELDPNTGAALRESVRPMLIPTDADTELYWSAEVMLSHSGRYLWATARAQRDKSITGYISAFLLGEDGQIIKRMFQIPTTTVGGWANAISPASWSDEYAAMTDYPEGYVQMFKMEGRQETKDGVEYTTARPVAKVNITDGGCCANVIWYS